MKYTSILKKWIENDSLRTRYSTWDHDLQKPEWVKLMMQEVVKSCGGDYNKYLQADTFASGHTDYHRKVELYVGEILEHGNIQGPI